jgi:CRISPR/Cas system-associated exonuclease Cas4 (RecB family)
MRTIRASEIGTYLYCKRAWWYQRQGVPSQNQQELAVGSAYHLRHGRMVIQAGLLRLAGWVILFLGITVFVIGLALQWLGSPVGP